MGGSLACGHQLDFMWLFLEPGQEVPEVLLCVAPFGQEVAAMDQDRAATWNPKAPVVQMRVGPWEVTQFCTTTPASAPPCPPLATRRPGCG